MKRSLISTTSCVAILSTIGTGTLAGSFEEGLVDPVVAPPVAVCLGGRTLDLRAGMLRSDNVWVDDIAAFDDEQFIGYPTTVTDKLGLGDAEGGFGSGQYTWDRCGSDIAIGAGFGSTTMQETEAGGSSLQDISISDDVDFQFFDIEYGRPFADKARAFAGLRVLNFSSDSEFSYVFASDESFASTASFTGIGPRAGAEFNTSAGTAGAFGIFGGASAALLFGERKNEVAYEYASFTSLNESESETATETVLNFEAELGASYNVTDAAAVKLGVNYIQINDIDWASGSDFVGDLDDDSEFTDLEAGDRSFVGAFVGLEIKF